MRLIVFLFFVFIMLCESSSASSYVTGSKGQYKSICEYDDYIHIIKYPPVLFMAPDGNPDQLWRKIRKKAAVGCLNGDCQNKVSVVCAISNGECSYSRNCGENDICVGHLVGKKMKHSCIVKKSGIAPKLNNINEKILIDFY